MSDKLLENYLGFDYRKDNKLVIFGKDWRMQFDTEPRTETSECIKVSLQSQDSEDFKIEAKGAEVLLNLDIEDQKTAFTQPKLSSFT